MESDMPIDDVPGWRFREVPSLQEWLTTEYAKRDDIIVLEAKHLGTGDKRQIAYPRGGCEKFSESEYRKCARRALREFALANPNGRHEEYDEPKENPHGKDAKEGGKEASD